MAPGKLLVDVNKSLIIRRPKVEDHTAAVPIFRYGKSPPIPDRGHKIQILDAGKSAFHTKRHNDLPLQMVELIHFPFYAAFAHVQLKFPDSV